MITKPFPTVIKQFPHFTNKENDIQKKLPLSGTICNTTPNYDPVHWIHKTDNANSRDRFDKWQYVYLQQVGISQNLDMAEKQELFTYYTITFTGLLIVETLKEENYFWGLHQPSLGSVQNTGQFTLENRQWNR